MNRNMNIEISFPPLVDHVSAHQNGLLDAVIGRVPVYCALIAAEEYVLSNSYCEGFAAGCNLANKWE